MSEPYWLETHEVSAIHNEIIVESGGATGILNEGALEATLFKPRNLYHYEEDITLYKLAASYGYGLVKNHCFVDGNKRIALIAVYTFLAINDIELIASETDAASFFLDLAASIAKQEEDMNRLENWLQMNSEPIPSIVSTQS